MSFKDGKQKRFSLYIQPKWEWLMKRVLVLAGGGDKLPIESMQLKMIEQRVKMSISDIFDLIVGTSAGSINGALMASGRITAGTSHDLAMKNLPDIFKKRFFRIPKYDRKKVSNLLHDNIGPHLQMEDMDTRFMSTSFGLVSGRTHYFKSWEPKDGKLALTEVVCRSFAAPLFFGSMIDPIEKEVWMDGGCGGANSPLRQAWVEINRQGWDDKRIHILSLGCGWSDYSMSYKDAIRARAGKQVMAFLSPKHGGLARAESIRSSVQDMREIARTKRNVTFQHSDQKIPAKMDKMDAVEYNDTYEGIGYALSRNIDYSKLIQQNY